MRCKLEIPAGFVAHLVSRIIIFIFRSMALRATVARKIRIDGHVRRFGRDIANTSHIREQLDYISSIISPPISVAGIKRDKTVVSFAFVDRPLIRLKRLFHGRNNAPVDREDISRPRLDSRPFSSPFSRPRPVAISGISPLFSPDLVDDADR